VLKPQLFGRYILVDRISTGGMAEVFLAKSSGVQGFEKILAIKRILPSISEDSDFTTMFIDEAKISANLAHVNVGQVFEFGQVGGQYYIAMEYIPGKDLRAIQTHLDETGRIMELPMALHVVGRLCMALDYAHRQKAADGTSMEIVHRDVSPPNVIVSFDGAVKLIDFGIAKAASRATRTRAGKLKGKFAYMSPEQVMGLPVDQRSDVFNLGILLHELLTNRRLFQGESQLATLNLVRKAEVAPPSTVNPEVSLEVDRIVLQALARDRDARYAWAAEMRADIERYLARTGVVFEPNHLADWMRGEFGGEIEAERRMRERLHDLKPGDAEVAPALAGGGASPPPTVVRAALTQEENALEALDDASPAAPLVQHTGEMTRDERPPGQKTADLPGNELPSTAIYSHPRAPEPPTDLYAGPSGVGPTGPLRLPSVASAGDVADDELSGEGSARDLEDALDRLRDPVDGDGSDDGDEPTDIEPPSTGEPAPLVLGPAAKKVRATSLARLPTLASDDFDPQDLPAPPYDEEVPLRRRAGAIAPGADRDAAIVGGALEVDSGGSRSLPAVDSSVPVDVRALGDGIEHYSRDELRARALQPPAGTRQVPGAPRFSSTQIMVLAASVTLFVAGAIVLLVLLLSHGGGTEPGSGRGSGSIVVTTSPPATCSVSIGGAPKGILEPGASLRLGGIAPGQLAISVECPGYEPFNATSEVTAGQVSFVVAELKKK
jgi:eukaryotic-like serine/threonine-protein kinase